MAIPIARLPARARTAAVVESRPLARARARGIASAVAGRGLTAVVPCWRAVRARAARCHCCGHPSGRARRRRAIRPWSRALVLPRVDHPFERDVAAHVGRHPCSGHRRSAFSTQPLDDHAPLVGVAVGGDDGVVHDRVAHGAKEVVGRFHRVLVNTNSARDSRRGHAEDECILRTFSRGLGLGQLAR